MNKRSIQSSLIKLTVLLIAVAGVLTVTPLLMKNGLVSCVMTEYGYFGVLMIGVLAGLNALVPIPAATLTPVFTAANLELPFIILALSLGTLIADFAGYSIGHFGRHHVRTLHPKLVVFFSTIRDKHHELILPIVFIYAAIAPLPNEAILIPLGLAGNKFAPLFLPLLLGNLVHQTLLVYGFSSIFNVLF